MSFFRVTLCFFCCKPLCHVLISQSYRITDMFDRDRSGSINVYEFRDLFNYINQWKSTFESIDSDRSGFIEYQELTRGKIFLTAIFNRFLLLCFVDMYDANNSGSIDLNEFNALFGCINSWKATFESYDSDRSGRIEEAELTRGEIQHLPLKSTSARTKKLLLLHLLLYLL